jgi:hypothetical protein
LHRDSVALYRDSVALYRDSVAPHRYNTLSHKNFSGVFSRLPFFYLSSTTDVVVNNCDAYTCAGCINNSPPQRGGRKRTPPVRGGLRPPCPPFGRELDPPGGASPPPLRGSPPSCQPRKKVPLPPSFSRMTNRVSSCCAIKGISYCGTTSSHRALSLLYVKSFPHHVSLGRPALLHPVSTPFISRASHPNVLGPNRVVANDATSAVVYRSFCKFRFGRWQEEAQRRHAMTSNPRPCSPVWAG